MQSDALLRLGWSAWFEARFAPYLAQELEPGRVSADYGEALAVSTAEGDVTGRVTGKMRHDAAAPADKAGGRGLGRSSAGTGRSRLDSRCPRAQERVLAKGRGWRNRAAGDGCQHRPRLRCQRAQRRSQPGTAGALPHDRLGKAARFRSFC